MTRKTLGTLIAALVALVVTAAPASAALPANQAQWIDGNNGYSSGLSCLGPIGGTKTELQVGGYTGYWGKPDLTYPKVGDLYWIHVYYQVLGLGCGLGLHGVQTETSLPAGTSLAIDPSSSDPAMKLRCFANSNGTLYNLTDQPWQHPDDPTIHGKYCESTATYNGANGTILSYALLAQGQTFELIFPVRSTRKLAGIGEPNDASRTTATLTDSAASGLATPYQWVFVGDRPVEADCPAAGATAASAITNTTAHTINFMCNWYRSGKASIEIGEQASGGYQVSTQQYNVPNSTQGFYVDQDWNNLTPGTTYQWRLKFVDDKGTAGTADDTTSFSQPRTFTTTGTRPAGPGTTPGAGGGGGQGGAGAPGLPTDGTPGTQTPAGDNGGGQQQQQQQIQQQQQQQDQTPADTTAPGLSASVPKLKLRDLLKKGMKAGVTCSEPCTIQAKLEVDAKTAKKLKLGKKATAIGSGKAFGTGKVTVTLKLTSKAKKALKRLKSLKASLVLTATDAAGNTSKPLTRKLSLKK